MFKYYVYIGSDGMLRISSGCDYDELNILKSKHGYSLTFDSLEEVKDYLSEYIKDEYIDKSDDEYWGSENNLKYYKD